MIEDLPFEALCSVLTKWPQYHDWFPKPRQVREEVLGNENMLREHEAELAWHRVLDAATQQPTDGEWEYPPGSGLTARDKFALRSLGGLERMSNLSIEGQDYSFTRRDFLQAWTAGWSGRPEYRMALAENTGNENDCDSLAASDGNTQGEV